ncbi:endo alpha-1,4 polygalactosaminidase [Solirubrobacter ginsenosidimutans]|uniref:Endo alpha-1,4 polygalactosaminidase n=1 Tax=Solirubrobacter ginsenosidimutans TaxID=490573 RepID=A0A9X3MS46_9ACTN|nr:endo alpha-1,4 polygalactosaminidase [Solirubrobacter ginsenosidimutans]MDA0161515.1 endo alpha-1,4 polygalactosaminidase [Solirubrobacter ginsenosidimutans]
MLPAPPQQIQAERMHVAASAGHVIRDATASGGRALALSGAATLRVRVGAEVEASVRVRSVACAGGPRVVVTIGETRVLSARVTSRRWVTLKASASVLAGRRTLTLRVAGTRCRRALRVDRVTLAEGAQKQRTIWVPSPTTTWQWQLSGTIDTSVDAQMYDVDLFDTPASVVETLHAQGRRAVCYLSAGSFETGRPDARAFPAAVLGEPLDGYPDERWLDIRRLDVLGPIMEARMDLCRSKGFDAVEADNVDGYANKSGFPLTADDQLRYNRFLAAAAHARGLSIGLKNDLDQVAQLEPGFDWALNEQCFQYDECDRLKPFVAAGKAVFVTEYELEPAAFCARAQADGFMAMVKRLELGPFRQPCW